MDICKDILYIRDAFNGWRCRERPSPRCARRHVGVSLSLSARCCFLFRLSILYIHIYVLCICIHIQLSVQLCTAETNGFLDVPFASLFFRLYTYTHYIGKIHCCEETTRLYIYIVSSEYSTAERWRRLFLFGSSAGAFKETAWWRRFACDFFLKAHRGSTATFFSFLTPLERLYSAF